MANENGNGTIKDIEDVDEPTEPPKKKFKPSPSKPRKIKIAKPLAIVLDIEGTIMPSDFYQNVLLPHARKNFRDFLNKNGHFEYVSKRIECIKDEYFSNHPEIEQSFNDYFTESAYNEYLYGMKMNNSKKQQTMKEENNEVNDEKTEIIDILDDDADDDDDLHDVNGLNGVGSGVNGVRVFSKSEFYKEKEIEMTMQIIEEWMDREQKNESIQYLQGLIIKNAFETGQICANLYKDVDDNIQKWKNEKIYVYTYSHGTIAAQRLLFKYSEFGDLSSSVNGYFDKSAVGSKKKVDSYFNLLREIELDISSGDEVDISSLLFISDCWMELNAANEAGMTTIQILRKGEHNEADDDYLQIEDFDQIEFIETMANKHDKFTVSDSYNDNNDNSNTHV